MTIAMIDGWNVSYDDPLEEIETKGRFAGRIKRKSRFFKGKGAKGRAKAFFNTVRNYNPKMEEAHYLAF